MAIEDCDRNKIHVCNDVIQAQCNERKCRPPDRNDLRNDLPGRNGDIDGEADEPIRPDGAQKYLHPGRCQHLLCCKVDNLRTISGDIEDSSV